MARLGKSDVQRIFTADGCVLAQYTRTHASALARVQARVGAHARACPLARVYRRFPLPQCVEVTGSVRSSSADCLCVITPYCGSPSTR
jgi:hypothetical protein